MNKEDIEKVLKQMALEYANEFKYHKAHEDKRKAKGRIGMHFISSDTDENYYFVEYGKTNTYNYKNNGGKIEFRYRFSHPRLDVYLPNKKGFASLEFSDYDEETLRDMVLEYQEEIERLNNIINEAIEYINENWGHWCSNHYKYATKTINILKGSDSNE